jgi:4-amino-4-deoxy-L-arabinose transferase-like glycosyltransferase
MNLRHRAEWEVLIVLAILVIALLPRILNLDIFITPDELKWVCRSINFQAGLSQGDFSRTYQTGHPGVITMWLGTLVIPSDPTDKWQEVCREAKVTRIVQDTSPDMLAQVTGYLFAARHCTAILTAASVVVVYFLVRQLLDRPTALLAAILMALDPFHVALSRVLHLDALTASFMTISVLSLLLYLRRKSSRAHLALSAVAAALAALNKAPALFLVPFVTLILLVAELRRGKPLLEIGRALLLWATVAGLTGVVLWPAVWVDPVGTVTGVLDTAVNYAEQPHSNLNFFWGQMRPDPGPFFYPVAWAFRTTPVVVVGLVLYAICRARDKCDQGPVLMRLLAYSLLFAGFMTIGQKKFDRYLLPIFPALEIVAAAGLSHLTEMLSRWTSKGNVRFVVLALVLLLSAGLALPYHPHYFPYYNPLLGGSAQARDTVLIGWGEGLEEAAHYLNQKVNAPELAVTLRNMAGFGPLFLGRATDTEHYDAATTDYVIIYVNQLQRGLNPELIERYYESQQPEYTVNLYGIDYAWIYPNLSYVAPMEYIASHVQADRDVILASRPSLFTKHYDGDWPLHAMDNGWSEAQIVNELETIPKDRRRVWYVKYLDEDPNLTLELIDHQLSTHMFKVAEHTYPDITLSLYESFTPTSFDISAIRSPLGFSFEGDLMLSGYGLVDREAQWGKELGVVLQWKALRDVNRHYAAFIHLVDEEGRTWGQGDKWLMNESLVPSAGWRAGEIVMDRYGVSLVKGIWPGEYSLLIGLYDRITGKRLQVQGSDGTPLGKHHELEAIDVRPSPLLLSPGDLTIRYPLERNLGGQLRLLGYDLDKAAVTWGDKFTLTLYWQALQEMDNDYGLVVQLTGGYGVWAEGRYLLGNKYHPSSQWRQGEVLWTQYQLEVDTEAPFTEGTLEIDVQHTDGRSLLEESCAVAKIEIQGRRSETPEIANSMAVNLGSKITFLGYDLDREEIKTGDVIHLTLYWQAQEEMEVSYTVFTHLLGEDNGLWGQKDSIPMGGKHPTTRWREKEIIADEFLITVEDGIPEGRYRLEVGMYNLETGERLPVFLEGKPLAGDRVLLGSELRVTE